ncbi:unnamed protein product, partial [Linum tenue]
KRSKLFFTTSSSSSPPFTISTTRVPILDSSMTETESQGRSSIGSHSATL